MTQWEGISSGRSTISSFQTEPSEDLIWINVATPQLEVSKDSPGMAFLCGPTSRCASVLPWVAKEQRKKLKVWLQDYYNSLLCGEEDELQPFHSLILRPPHLARHKAWVETDVHVQPVPRDQCSGSEAEEGDWSTILQLEFVNLELRCSRTHGSPGGPSSTGIQGGISGKGSPGAPDRAEVGSRQPERGNSSAMLSLPDLNRANVPHVQTVGNTMSL